MCRHTIFTLLFISMAFSPLFFHCQDNASQNQNQNQIRIYNEKADPEQDIADALNEARKKGKHVLLMFGGNWCPWCHRLHHLLETDSMIRDFLKRNYFRVMVNVPAERNERDMAINEKYGDPFQHGFPVLVFLNGRGERLAVEGTGSLEKTVEEGEEKGHDPEAVLNVLKKWAPPL